MTDEWEMLDGREIEDTVENSVKTISTVYRIFNSKEDKSMMEVVGKIKEDVDYFRQYVKLAVSLRKPGMCDRHWD